MLDCTTTLPGPSADRMRSITPRTAGGSATTHLIAELRRLARESQAETPEHLKALLVDALARLLAPLERSLVIGPEQPTVMMVAGVNGAGKTTTIGKLTHRLADQGATVLLAAADTFRAPALKGN